MFHQTTGHHGLGKLTYKVKHRRQPAIQAGPKVTRNPPLPILFGDGLPHLPVQALVSQALWPRECRALSGAENGAGVLQRNAEQATSGAVRYKDPTTQGSAGGEVVWKEKKHLVQIQSLGTKRWEGGREKGDTLWEK